MDHKPYKSANKARRHVAQEDEWMSPAEFAQAYHVSRSTAYEAFRRLDTVRIGGCVRARRSDIEERLAKYGRV